MTLALGYDINNPGVGQNSQTRDSLAGISELLNNDLGEHRDVVSAAPEGFWTSKTKASAETASRLNGILEFKRSEGSDPANERYTRAMTFVGAENIRGFFSTFRNNLAYSAKVEKTFVNSHMWKQNLAQFLVLLAYVNSGFLGQMFQEIQSPNEQTLWKFLAFAGIELYLSQDLWIQRFLKMDFTTIAQIDRLEAMVSSEKEEYWGVLSKNYQISERVQRDFVAGALANNFDNLVEWHAIESASFFDRLLHGMRDYLRAGWMGVDLVVRKRRGEQPELTLVFRGQRQRRLSFSRKPVRTPVTAPDLQTVPVPER